MVRRDGTIIRQEGGVVEKLNSLTEPPNAETDPTEQHGDCEEEDGCDDQIAVGPNHVLAVDALVNIPAGGFSGIIVRVFWAIRILVNVIFTEVVF